MLHRLNGFEASKKGKRKMTLDTKYFFFICSYLICNVCICFTFDFEFSLAFGFVCIFITYIVLYFHLYFHLYVFVSGGNNKFFERRKQATANLSLHRLHCVVYKRFTTDNNRLLILFLCFFLYIFCSFCAPELNFQGQIAKIVLRCLRQIKTASI